MGREGRKDIDIEQLKLGRLAALENAVELVQDAEVLYNAGRWSRSLFLSQIATEELGKYMMIVSAVANVTAGTMDWTAFWQRFRNHKAKFGNVLHLEYLVERDVPAAKYLKKLPSEKKQNDLVKMLSLYSDFDGTAFYRPSELINQEVARVVLEVTKQRFEFQQAFERDLLEGGRRLDSLSREKVLEFRRRLGIEKLFPEGSED